MASEYQVAKSDLKVGVHTCRDDAVGNIHLQEYTQFSLMDDTTIELTHTETSFHHETDAIDEITETEFTLKYTGGK